MSLFAVAITCSRRCIRFLRVLEVYHIFLCVVSDTYDNRHKSYQVPSGKNCFLRYDIHKTPGNACS